MKLRNKKTGEIKELPDGFFCGDNLKKICEEWEDYEESKEYWYIDTTEGTVVEHTQEMFELTDKERKQIGNHFETEEEAKQAVEKLKAFKRLQDLGFRFDGIRFRGEHNYIEWKIKAKNELTDDEIKEFRDALQKVFGGK